ncbi:MAG TPA: ABC transporter ATP-binding protein [Vicinamibacterales bacterium]|nr:ABC transporter ATP-binding protein [Vicinamibacterales bacterium]
MSLVVLEKVSKTYAQGGAPVHALRDATLTIEAREFVALMGRSGSGKSTLLGIIGAMNAPTSGRIEIDGIDLYGLPAERLADFRRAYLGFVFQHLFLMPYLTALENVMLPLAAARIANARQRTMASDALARVGLGHMASRLPRELSGGEQQRVAIARAIVNTPSLLLADEPTGCLDTATGGEILDVLHELRRDGLTIFLVTHDPAVAAHADRVIHVEDGIVLNGSRERTSEPVAATSAACQGAPSP